MKVLDNAAEICCKYLNGRKIDGFPVSAEAFTSRNPLVDRIKNCHALFHEFSNASKKKIKHQKGFTCQNYAHEKQI